jgi:hypothetical protein
MPVKLNTEFNYRYQVIGETIWEKIKTLQGFMEGRLRAQRLEEVGHLRHQAKIAKLQYMIDTGAPEHEILDMKADLKEYEHGGDMSYAYELNRQEIAILERLMKEAYDIAEPTRLRHPDGTPYSDEEMFEANAANEFTAMIGKDIYSEIVANGRPSPAKIRNAMSNPITWNALKNSGLIPKESFLLESNNNPLQVELKQAQIEDNSGVQDVL